MSFEAHLTQTCTIIRPTSARADRYNASTFVDQVVAENVLCRQSTKQVRVLDPDKAEYSSVQIDLVLLPAGTDVQMLDKLYLNGSTTARIVKDCTPRRTRAIHHITVELETLNG